MSDRRNHNQSSSYSERQASPDFYPSSGSTSSSANTRPLYGRNSNRNYSSRQQRRSARNEANHRRTAPLSSHGSGSEASVSHSSRIPRIRSSTRESVSSQARSQADHGQRAPSSVAMSNSDGSGFPDSESSHGGVITTQQQRRPSPSPRARNSYSQHTSSSGRDPASKWVENLPESFDHIPSTAPSTHSNLDLNIPRSLRQRLNGSNPENYRPASYYTDDARAEREHRERNKGLTGSERQRLAQEAIDRKAELSRLNARFDRRH